MLEKLSKRRVRERIRSLADHYQDKILGDRFATNAPAWHAINLVMLDLLAELDAGKYAADDADDIGDVLDSMCEQAAKAKHFDEAHQIARVAGLVRDGQYGA